MADKRTTPEAAASASPRKRAAPTIDLTAKEVPPVAAAVEPSLKQEQARANPEAAPAGKNPSVDNSLDWLRANISTPALFGGGAGAAITTLILCGIWLASVVPLRDLGSTVTSTVDTKSIDALKGRVAKIEDTVAKLPPGDAGITERVAAADNALKALGLALTALNRRSDVTAANATLARDRAEAAEKAMTELRISVQDAAKNASTGISSAELDGLQKRMVGLEQSVKVAAQMATTDTPARLALSAAGLRDAAVSGAPFAVALSQAKSLGADESALAPLEPFAASGVPTQATLAQELRVLLPAMLKLSGAQGNEGGFIDRLQANAGKLVRIRPVDAPPGDDAPAVLALNDLGKLPDATRAPAQAWMKKANERQAALTAARAFVVETARALGKQ